MRASGPIDLKSALAASGPLDPARAVNLVGQLAAALDAAHAARSTHRAVTPAGILLSRLPSGEDRAHLALPPEPAARTAVSADVYALTAVLYECLTGLPPDAPVSPPSRRRPGVPAGFDAVVARGMADNPGDRYRSAGELASAAARVLGGPAQRTPSGAQTRAMQLPPAPTNVIHVQPQGNPATDQRPIVSYPHSQPVPPPPPGPPRAGPPPPPSPRRKWQRHKVIALVAVAVFVIVGIVAAIVLIPRSARHAATPATTPPPKYTYGSEATALPFPPLDVPKAVAIGAGGIIYVLSSVLDPSMNTDGFSSAPKELLKLEPGSGKAAQVTVPGVDLRLAEDLAIDAAGNLYLSDGKYVWELPAGAAAPIRLPFRGLLLINAITVDGAGNVYAAGVATSAGYEAKYVATKLAAGAARETPLGFTNLYQPHAIAVDKAGNVFVGDSIRDNPKGRVLKLAAGESTPTLLPFTAVKEAGRVVVDSTGNVFVADSYTRAIFELPAGESATVQIRIDEEANGLAVDAAGNLVFACGARIDRSGRLQNPGGVFKLAPYR